MDDPDGSYAPQSPDLSAYHSSFPPDQPSTSYYPSQHPQYQPGYIPPNYQPNLYAPQISAQPSSPYLSSAMPRNGQIQPNDDGGGSEWAPEPSIRGGARKVDKKKVHEVCEKLAPGIAEGIEVKTKFPVARIKRIMQADEDVGKVAQVTPTAVSKALELFMISVVSKASSEARVKGSKRISAAHLKQAVEKDDQLDFLATIISKVPDAPAPKKDEDSEEAGEGKKRKAGTRKRKKDPDDS